MTTQALSYGAIALALALAGCGASAGGATSQTGPTDAAAVDELKGIEQEIDQRMEALFKPLQEADALVADLGAMRTRLGLSPDAFAAALSGTAGQEADASSSTQLGPNVQSEITSIKDRAVSVVASLQNMSAEADKLLAAIAEAIPKVPALAAEGTASAQLAINNPFADASAKAKAQADVAALAGLPDRIVAKLREAQAQAGSLPQRVQAAMAALAAATPGLAVNNAFAAGSRPAETGAAPTDAGKSTPGSQAAITASAAIDLIVPRIQVGAERVRARFDRAQGARLDLGRATRDAHSGPAWARQAVVVVMQNAPLALPNGSKPPPEVADELTKLAERTVRSLAELGAVHRDITALNEAIGEASNSLPKLVESAREDAQVILDHATASQSEKRRARVELESLTAREADVVAGLQTVRDQIAPWTAKAELATAALVQELSPGALDLTALASSKVSVADVLEPFPPIARAPLPAHAEEEPSATVAASETVAADQSRDGDRSSRWWYLASGVLTAASLGSAIYAVERDSGVGDCLSRPPGYGCANTNVLKGQRAAGIVASASFGVGAIAALIVALLSGDADEEGREHALSCTVSGVFGAACGARF